MNSHYAHVADPLYQLLRKNQRFLWSVTHVKATWKLKQLLQSSPTLRKANHECGKTVIVIVDTSPTKKGWAVGTCMWSGLEQKFKYLLA